MSIPARTSLTGRSSPSGGQQARNRTAGISGSTTSTAPTGPAGRCAASTSRSRKPRKPSPGRHRSSGTGSSSSPEPTSLSTGSWKPRARTLAGLKGYITNLAACPDGTPVTAEFVIGSYHQLWRIEKSFRMSKHDLRARPIYHHKRESIDAHLTIVFAALAISRSINTPQAGRSASSSRPPADTAQSASASAAIPLPPLTRSPATCATRSSRSSKQVRAKPRSTAWILTSVLLSRPGGDDLGAISGVIVPPLTCSAACPGSRRVAAAGGGPGAVGVR